MHASAAPGLRLLFGIADMVSALPCYGAGAPRRATRSVWSIRSVCICPGSKQYWHMTELKRCLGIIVPAVLGAAVPAVPA